MKTLIALIVLATLGAGCVSSPSENAWRFPHRKYYKVRVKEPGKPAQYIMVRERTDRNGTIRGRSSERGRVKYYTVR
jgi:hypothetical protein